MYQECIDAYLSKLSVKDTGAYKKPAELIAEYLDGRGITSPSAEDWVAFEVYVRDWYLAEKGKAPSDTTVTEKYVGRAKKFIASVQTPEQVIDTPQPKPAVRVNAFLDGTTYEQLALLSAIKHSSITALLNEATRLYIRQELPKVQSTLSALMNI